MTEVWSGFAALTADECRRLLATNRIGRVAVTAGALPCVLPVQYTFTEAGLVLRTPAHHGLSDSIDGQVIGFETDDLDLEHGVGWCVSVTGTAQVLHGAAVGRIVHPWFSDGTVLSVTTDLVVGHRVAA